jgi:hypothetical protein
MPDNMNKNKEGRNLENLNKKFSDEEKITEEDAKKIPEKESSDIEKENKISEKALEKVKEKASSSEEKERAGEIKEGKIVEELSQMENAEDRLSKLIQIASQEGPEKAIKIAGKLNGNYILDKIHDSLVDEGELREELVRKGFIKES